MSTHDENGELHFGGWWWEKIYLCVSVFMWDFSKVILRHTFVFSHKTFFCLQTFSYEKFLHRNAINPYCGAGICGAAGWAIGFGMTDFGGWAEGWIGSEGRCGASGAKWFCCNRVPFMFVSGITW